MAQDDNSIPKENLGRRALQWTTAIAVGLTSGFIGLAEQARIEFRKKISEFISKLDITNLQEQRSALDEGREVVGEIAQEQNILGGTYKAFGKDAKKETIDTLIKMKELHEQRPRLLDENAITRLLRRFDGSNQAHATETYLKNAPSIKNAYTDELNKFAKLFGIESEGAAGYLKGTLQRFRYMGKDTKSDLVVKTVIGVGVGVAGTFMFQNSLNTHNKLNELVQRLRHHESGKSQG